MKYGETLRQRSIPLWETYNVDYNDVKQLIKLHTTKNVAHPTPIPGKESEPKTDPSFEDELHGELCNQHQRIDLFVQSKAGEIARRLLHLDKQVAQLNRRTGALTPNLISVHRLEKFSRLEEEILKAGEEIQSLSRFVGAQRLAFQKLLKKYKRWTGSSKLGERFQKELLDRPGSFSKRDFGPLLTQWTEVLAAVRAPFQAGVLWQADAPGGKVSDTATAGKPHSPSHKHSDGDGKVTMAGDGRSGVAAVHASCQNGSVNDFDTAFALSPLGPGGGKALYWVHPDNLVELHVFLLQYTRLRNPMTPNSSGRSSRAKSSPTALMDGPAVWDSKPQDDVGVFICDDLQWFAKSRSSAPVSESAEKAAASIRYSSAGEAVVVVENPFQDVQQTSESPKGYCIHKTKLKRKILRRLFESDSHSPVTCNQSLSSLGSHAAAIPGEEQISHALRAWLAQHREVQPLVQIHMRRTRFVGLRNSQSAGVWATLDRDIQMRKCPSGAFDGGEDLFDEGRRLGATLFPHAILEIRYEGGQGTAEIVAALDRSHLAERVRGFSLGTHAVATLCQPKGMARLSWLPVLDHDIRKLPAPVKPRDRRNPNGSTHPTESTGRTSVSALSTADGRSSISGPLVESPVTSAPESPEDTPVSGPKKKRRFRSRREHPLRLQTNFDSPPPRRRYWNEFDDGDEGSPNEAYTIFVDPHAESALPGAALISRLMERIYSTSKKATSWLRPTPRPSTPERQPLIANDYFFVPSSPEGDDESDLENNTVTLSRPAQQSQAPRHYSTIQAPSASTTRALRRRDQHLSYARTASLIISGILLLGGAVLGVISSSKVTGTAASSSVTVIASVVASLAFGIVGLGTILTTSCERRSRILIAMVALFLTMECLCGGALLVMVLDSD